MLWWGRRSRLPVRAKLGLLRVLRSLCALRFRLSFAPTLLCALRLFLRASVSPRQIALRKLQVSPVNGRLPHDHQNPPPPRPAAPPAPPPPLPGAGCACYGNMYVGGGGRGGASMAQAAERVLGRQIT